MGMFVFRTLWNTGPSNIHLSDDSFIKHDSILSSTHTRILYKIIVGTFGLVSIRYHPNQSRYWNPFVTTMSAMDKLDAYRSRRIDVPPKVGRKKRVLAARGGNGRPRYRKPRLKVPPAHQAHGSVRRRADAGGAGQNSRAISPMSPETKMRLAQSKAIMLAIQVKEHESQGIPRLVAHHKDCEVCSGIRKVATFDAIIEAEVSRRVKERLEAMFRGEEDTIRRQRLVHLHDLERVNPMFTPGNNHQ